MDVEEGQNDKFTIEDDDSVKYGNDLTNPPLVVVVQGGKNV